MMQIGEVDTSSSSTMDCGSNVTGVFVETETSGGNYVCPKTNGIAAFGNGGLFAVAHAPSGGLEAFWNSNVFYGPIDVGFSAGYSIARAESRWTSSGPTYNMTWGPSGQTAWQFKTDGGSYQTINVSSGVQNAPPLDVWHLGGTPSPFTIYYSG
jgi:hypothetical protein